MLIKDQWLATQIEAAPAELPILIEWGLPPAPSWIKLNVDGARKAELARSGVGFVILSSNAEVIAAASIPVHDTEINQVELVTAWNAVSWSYKKFDPSMVWPEGDSMRVVELLNQALQSSDDPLLADCKIFLNNMQTIKVSHLKIRKFWSRSYMVNIETVVSNYTLGENCFPLCNQQQKK